MLEVSEGVQCTPCIMIERGNFEPLSPKKDFDLKDFKGFDFNVEVNCRRVNIMFFLIFSPYARTSYGDASNIYLYTKKLNLTGGLFYV
jgi:hypothetical protein